MMRTQTAAQAAAQATPAPPPAPQAPPAPAVAGEAAVYSTAQLGGRPMTRADYQQLQQRKGELSEQLLSAQKRRNDVAQQLRRADGGQDRTGLEQRLQVLDGRLAQLENDIALNGRMLASAPTAFTATTTGARPDMGNPWQNLRSGQVTGISIVFILGVLMPLAISMGRAILRRTSTPKPAPQILESAARIERMEQAIDTIAVEIERISEGQRFVTGLLAKRAEAEPLGIPVRAGGQ